MHAHRQACNSTDCAVIKQVRRLRGMSRWDPHMLHSLLQHCWVQRLADSHRPIGACLAQAADAAAAAASCSRRAAWLRSIVCLQQLLLQLHQGGLARQPRLLHRRRMGVPGGLASWHVVVACHLRSACAGCRRGSSAPQAPVCIFHGTHVPRHSAQLLHVHACAMQRRRSLNGQVMHCCMGSKPT